MSSTWIREEWGRIVTINYRVPTHIFWFILTFHYHLVIQQIFMELAHKVGSI